MQDLIGHVGHRAPAAHGSYSVGRGERSERRRASAAAGHLSAGNYKRIQERNTHYINMEKKTGVCVSFRAPRLLCVHYVTVGSS